MDIEKELRMLQAIRDDGTLTVNEFDVAAEKIMSDYERDHDPDLQSPQSIDIQRELDRIDQQWELDRQKYTAIGRRGKRYVPTKTVSLMMGVAGFLFGFAWVSDAFRSGQSLDGAQFSLMASVSLYFGIFVTIGFCCVSYSNYWKAGRYEEAQEEYRHQRDLLVAQQSML